MIHAELQREERASREKELEEDAREERQDLKDHGIRLRMTEREWRQQCREEEAAEEPAVLIVIRFVAARLQSFRLARLDRHLHVEGPLHLV